MFSSVRFLFLGILSVFLSLCAFGQDLGSSNDLFVNKNAASTTGKRTSVKRKTTASKHKNSVRTAATSSRSSKKAENSTAIVKKAEPDRVPASPEKSAVVSIKPTAALSSSPAVDEQFERLIVDGNRARDERDYSAAESAYTRAKNLKPKESRAAYGLGNLYSDQQRWEEAEVFYRAA